MEDKFYNKVHIVPVKERSANTNITKCQAHNSMPEQCF